VRCSTCGVEIVSFGFPDANPRCETCSPPRRTFPPRVPTEHDVRTRAWLACALLSPALTGGVLLVLIYALRPSGRLPEVVRGLMIAIALAGGPGVLAALALVATLALHRRYYAMRLAVPLVLASASALCWAVVILRAFAVVGSGAGAW
jgi:hypothetical protein